MGAGAPSPSARCVSTLLVIVLLGEGWGCARAVVGTGGQSHAAYPKGFVFGTATEMLQVEGMVTGGGRRSPPWRILAARGGGRDGLGIGRAGARW